MRTLAVLLLLCLLAGCVTQGEAVLKPDEGASTAFPQPREDAILQARLSTEMTLKNCTGLSFLTRLPPGMQVHHPPQNWSRDETYTIVYFRLFECGTIVWGPFERGPVRLIFDSEDDVNTPPGCVPDPAKVDSVSALANLLIDDKEIAAWGHTRFGIVSYAQISKSEHPEPGFSSFMANWTVPGQPQSEIRTVRLPEIESRATAVERLVWDHDGHLVVMDVTQDWTFQNTNGPVGLGTMAPPMVYAETGLTNYVGEGGSVDTAEESATLTEYADSNCQDPL